MNPQGIKNIRLADLEQYPSGGYVWEYAGELFHIKADNDVPLLSNDYPSQIWLYKHYGYIMRLFDESANSKN
jgi:hypothetical protein